MSHFKTRWFYAKIPCYVADGEMEVVMIGRDVLKTLGIEPLTQLKELRAAGELKEITFPYDSSKSKEEERFKEIDDEVPIAEELAEVELDAAITEIGRNH